MQHAWIADLGRSMLIHVPSVPEIANFRTKYFIPSKVFTDEGGIK